MTDFLFWLHANYIKPQVDAAIRGPYACPLDTLHNELCEAQRRDLDKALEFLEQDGIILLYSHDRGYVKKNLRQYTCWKLEQEWCVSEREGAWLFCIRRAD